MNFLSPLFLVGALAVAGPILFHLIRRVVRERMIFSSLMFLKPTPPKVTKRRKLDNLLLLLLRCLILVLLAAGFARPFIFTDDMQNSVSGEARQIILLVDSSASMKREGVWRKAVSMASEFLDKATPTDQIALMTYDRQPHTLVSFSDWSGWALEQRADLARQRLDAVSPGWMGTQLGLAMTTAAEQFVDDSSNGKPASRRELVLISDMQEGAKLDGLQGHEWPAGTKVIIKKIEAKVQPNAGLEFLSDATASVAAGKDIRVRVANASDSDQEKFKLSWVSQNGSSPIGQPMEIYLPHGQARSFPTPTNSAGATYGKLQLTGDEVDFDNVSYYAAPEPERLLISWFGLEAANDPEGLRYYAQRAFPGTPRRQVEILPPTVNTVFSPDLLNQSVFAVVPRTLSADEATAMRAWLTGGKTALLVLTNAEMSPTLAAITGMSEIQVSEADGNYALLGSIDFTHPIFSPFSDPRFSDFSHIHFWKHRKVDFPATPQVRVLAKFDDGSAAITQINVGKGNLLVMASGWNPVDSQFALSSKFLPLMQSVLEWSGAAVPPRFQFLTGDSIPSPVTAASSVSTPTGANSGSQLEWQKPDGKKLPLAAGVAFTETDLPGIYSVSYSGKTKHFAVNLPLDESRTAPMSSDEFARLGVPLEGVGEIPAARIVERQRHLQEAELENRQKIWRWLIVGVLAVTFGEIILGGWLARRTKVAEATT